MRGSVVHHSLNVGDVGTGFVGLVHNLLKIGRQGFEEQLFVITKSNTTVFSSVDRVANNFFLANLLCNSERLAKNTYAFDKIFPLVLVLGLLHESVALLHLLEPTLLSISIDDSRQAHFRYGGVQNRKLLLSQPVFMVGRSTTEDHV